MIWQGYHAPMKLSLKDLMDFLEYINKVEDAHGTKD